MVESTRYRVKTIRVIGTPAWDAGQRVTTSLSFSNSGAESFSSELFHLECSLLVNNERGGDPPAPPKGKKWACSNPSEVFEHAGLLCDEPPGTASLPFIKSSDIV